MRFDGWGRDFPGFDIRLSIRHLRPGGSGLDMSDDRILKGIGSSVVAGDEIYCKLTSLTEGRVTASEARDDLALAKASPSEPSCKSI
ncbi:hypothetical protein NBRC116594_09160 [Shimia sp. NS0008-38b]